MKTYNFSICKYHVTITIEKKNYEVINPKIVSEQYASTVNEPLPEIKMEEKIVYGDGFDQFTPFYTLCKEYIEAQKDKLSDSTLRGYTSIITNHLDTLMTAMIGEIDETTIQEAFDEEIEKGFSVKTLKGYKSFILKVLAQYRPDFHPNIRVTKENVDETT